jgi:hypothetical protein
MTADQLLAAGAGGSDTDRRTAAAECAEWLHEVLADGPRAVAEIEAEARAAGLLGDDDPIAAAKPFRAARAMLGVRSRRDGFGSAGRWLWSLPDVAVPDAALPPDTETVL